ncbi:MAG: CopG family antitoxin [candidate division WWE3 bacterium]|nr:CopG family antitoxin [candidate division WWE3 bacterium]
MKKANKIPKFNNLKDEAHFWDTHDITDYLSELTPAKLSFKTGVEKKEVVTIRVAESLKKELTRVADCYDISPSSLVRMWVVEKLRSADVVC